LFSFFSLFLLMFGNYYFVVSDILFIFAADKKIC